MKTNHTPFETIQLYPPTRIEPRTAIEKFYYSYAMLRVCIARMMRGDKPRFRHFLLR